MKTRSWLTIAFTIATAILAVGLFQDASVYALNTYETDNNGTIYDAFNNYIGDDRSWLTGAICELQPTEMNDESGQIVVGTSSTYKCTSSTGYEWTCSSSVSNEAAQKNVFQCDDDNNGGTIMTDSDGINWLCDSYATTTGTCIAQDGSGRTCAMGSDCEWDRSDYDIVSGSNSLTTPDACEKKDLAGWFVCSMAEAVTNVVNTIINNLLLPMLQWRILV